MSVRNLLIVAAVAALPTVALASDLKNGRTDRHDFVRQIPAYVSGITNPAEANYTFPSFSNVATDAISATELTGAPAGNYTSFSVSVDWSAAGGDPWSNEGIWAFTNESPFTNGTVFHADPGAAPNSAGDGNAVTLQWNGFMDAPYAGGDPLYFNQLQIFEGSSANWDNISITIGTDTATAPDAMQTMLGGSLSSDLSASQIVWYKFDYSGLGAFTIDTIGSDLTENAGEFEDDTEIALYSSSGSMIDTNDDIDFAGGMLTSSLTFGDGELPAGTYYLAAGGFDSAFGGSFGASSTSISTGKLVVNGLSNVPEPTTLGLLAAVGTLALRRRK